MIALKDALIRQIESIGFSDLGCSWGLAVNGGSRRSNRGHEKNTRKSQVGHRGNGEGEVAMAATAGIRMHRSGIRVELSLGCFKRKVCKRRTETGQQSQNGGWKVGSDC